MRLTNKKGYHIPANYTDSGKLFGGLLELRNTIEAILLVVIIGYPLFQLIQLTAKIKFVIMIVVLIPVGIFALMGIGGFSIFQYAGHMIRFALDRRILSYRRIKTRHADKEKRKARKKKAKV